MDRMDILNFLKEGNFNNLNFSITRETLTNILGDTDYVVFSRKKDKIPSVYKYGYVEFYFTSLEDDRLYGIQIEPQVGPAPDKNLNINYRCVLEKPSYELVKQFLIDYCISFKEEYDEYDKEIRLIRTEGEVLLHFNEDMELISINKFIKISERKDIAKLKQINIAVQEHIYNRLWHIAKQKKLSISNICSDIVTKEIQKNYDE